MSEPAAPRFRIDTRDRGEWITAAWAPDREWAEEITASLLDRGRCGHVRILDRGALVGEYAIAGDAYRVPAARDVARWLDQAGWRREETDRNGAQVWRLGNRARILVPPPGGPARDDDEDVLRHTLAAIARAENRPLPVVRQEIAAGSES